MGGSGRAGARGLRRRRGAGNMASRPKRRAVSRVPPALGDEEEEDEVEEQDEDDSDEEEDEEDEVVNEVRRPCDPGLPSVWGKKT